MVRKKAKHMLGILFAAVLAVGLAAVAGCDETNDCEGDDCNSSPIIDPGDGGDDGDDGTLSPICEKMCGHVFGDCAEDNRIANGDPVSDEECIIFCNGLTEAERGCLSNVPCHNLVLCLDREAPPEGN